MLGRPADPAERATDITSLTAEDDLAPFLRRLVHSPELQRKVVASHLPERARADFLTWPEPESDPGDDDFLDTPATPRVIGEAVSLILGRPPAEADIEAQPPGITVFELRKTLLRSDEFQRELAKPSAIPPPSTEEIDAMKTIFVHIPRPPGLRCARS